MKSIITLTLGVLLLFSSCVNEDLSGGGNAPEGMPALVSLKMNMATMGSKQKTRAMTPDEEKKIENIRVMIFDGDDHIVTNKKYIGSSTSINIETYSGKNRKIYIVANAVDAVDTHLSAIDNLGQLKAAQTTASELGFGLNENKPLTMTGQVENVDIQPGSSTIPEIQLNFLTAKLTLNVVNRTRPDEKVTILGWDVVNVAVNTFIYLGDKDANADKLGDPEAWLTTNTSNPFTPDNVDPQIASMEIYLTENRRGGRRDRALPDDESKRYPGMSVNDGNDKGKTWYQPDRATAILIHAMHVTATETKRVGAWIYLGENNHSNYDLVRGNHYTFTVTVNGLNDINIDTNVDYLVRDFRVLTGTNLIMDAHPDFRPMQIFAPQGTVTIEIVDEDGKTYNQPGFTADWLKISPLNLMYHQVRQSAPNDAWQQNAGAVGGFVRAKYIPHHSVRAVLMSYGIGGWNPVPPGKENDDNMKFSDATYRMCYKITDIPFDASVSVTNKTLCVYADEFLSDGASRTATIRVSYYKGNSTSNPEVQNYTISQNGYISVYDNSISDAGLLAQNHDGTPGLGTPKKFVIEQTEEATLAMNPGIDPSVQMTISMQWGFNGIELYNKADKYRNGSYLTANAVYHKGNSIIDRDVNNEPTGFGTSLRPMYGNNITGGDGVIPNYTGSTVGPYYYPKATEVIYHPIYKSSAARYCHEKNRDMNGDGIIDVSETKWYLPSQHELQMIWIAGKQRALVAGYYSCSTEYSHRENWSVNFSSGGTHISGKIFSDRVRCIRGI